LNETATTGPIKFQFNNQPFKLANSHFVFERLNELIIGQFKNLNSQYYIPMTENALQCIFKLADNPILIVESLSAKLIDLLPPLKHLTVASKNKMKQQQLPPVPLFNEEIASTQTLTQPTSSIEEANFTAKTAEMSRFFSFIGFVSTKLLIFLNQSVVCELKRRKMCKENIKQDNGKHTPKSASSSSKASAKNRRKSIRPFNQNGTNGDTLEEEMGLQGAEAEDSELMFIESLIDQKICFSQPGNNSMIAQILPAIVHILKEPSKYQDETLQLSCSLALAKIMLLSQRICTQNLQLLFTLVEKSPHALVRSQLIIAIGDLVYR
jgi:condensin complex subunit 1